MNEKGQVKDKKRVADRGEVFTAQREVNAMLDLVKPETERIDSRFLEPACGDGNFLSEILRRKLVVVKRQYRKSKLDYEKNSVLAVSSIYGIDIQSDNVVECRERLFDIWNKEYSMMCKNESNDECREAVQFVLMKNIICGNALSLMQVNDNGNDIDEPIIFCEWSFVTGSMIKRRDFRLDQMMRDTSEQITLFTYDNTWKWDNETQAWIPKPIKEYPLIHYRRVMEDG